MREYIYFAVDYDVLDGYITSTVKPYFEALMRYLRPTVTFTILAYMARGTSALDMRRVWFGLSCFVGDMSTASAATWVPASRLLGV